VSVFGTSFGIALQIEIKQTGKQGKWKPPSGWTGPTKKV
jgi:hypothetical protein